VKVISPKKLIEVALPLDAINAAAARETSIRHGHPSTLHLWWARRPLAAARAVIFAQLVHDPEDLWRCQNPGVEPNQQHKGHWTKARARLFKIIEDLVLWENTTNEDVLKPAREAIRQSWRETCELNKDHPQANELFDPANMPALHDPFAGGGSIPLEAQRLGLEAYASDLNPVAVLINKAMVEFPPQFADRPPVNPVSVNSTSLFSREWRGVAGLAEDVRYYGQWMRDEAQKRIGGLYPPVEITKEMATERPDLMSYLGHKLTVIAWLWARTVKSPNPAYSHIDVPLVGTFVLSTKPGKEAYIQPEIDQGGYRFKVRTGKPPDEARTGTKAARGANFRCIISGAALSGGYIKAEGMAGRMGVRMMAIVAEGTRGRVYLSPSDTHVEVATSAQSSWGPDLPIAYDPASGATYCVLYGLRTFRDLFTARQLATLNTLCGLLHKAHQRIVADFLSINNGSTLEAANQYASAVALYLSLVVSKTTNRANNLATWMPSVECPGHLFRRHAIPMSWDFAEGNTISGPSGSFQSMLDDTLCAFPFLAPTAACGHAVQADAASQRLSLSKVISTDPPYFDNVPYADIADLFYVWLRQMLRPLFSEILSTIAVPKAEELVAFAGRQGSKEAAAQFFLDRMTLALRQLAKQAHPGYPVTIYYAFKQADTQEDATNSKGWEAFLEAVRRADLCVDGTWPMRTERSNRSVSLGTNSLASSIVLVCRPRNADAAAIPRRQFIRELNETLPSAIDAMTRESEGLHSPVAPVDLSQAVIGPGMAVFSKYSAVLEADGSPISIKTALQLINRFLAEDDFDADTQFCLHWFEQHGWETGKFGEADTLARAKGTSVAGVQNAGVIEAGGGNVRLLKWREYPDDWDPATDSRLPVWEALHQLIRAYNTDGDSGAAKILAGVASKAEAARQLAYRLYTLCERAGRAEDARAYNEVVTGWSGIESAAVKVATPQQRTLFDNEETS
jgi:putative DNA methylase